MTRQKEPAMSHETALNTYYGGVKGLSAMGIPFTCKCGGRDYPTVSETTGEMIAHPVMHVEDTFKHIRKVHRERIKKAKKE